MGKKGKMGQMAKLQGRLYLCLKMGHGNKGVKMGKWRKRPMKVRMRKEL